MLFKRVNFSTASGTTAPMRQGDGMLGAISPVIVATDTNLTLTVAQMAGGMIQYTGFTAGRTLTTPTAALILAAAPDMDIGDSFQLLISVVPAFAATWAAGAGVTLLGRATTPASSWSIVTVIKLSATTVSWNVS
jgi:hypothetical protein